MVIITHSVGNGGKNLPKDVLTIQKSLNKIKPALGTRLLAEDKSYGKNAAAAITAFQKNLVGMNKPDGRFDPGGNSIKKLNELLGFSNNILFPLKSKPSQSYKMGTRAFGSLRSSGKRKHAGVDLYAAKGTPIRAIKDGTVIQSYPFYLGTLALEIYHGNILVRYGEISHVATGVTAGASVKRGQIIAYVGELVFSSGNKMSMLHIEFYKGTASGSLTVRGSRPYQRRIDLIDPTKLLDASVMK